MTKTVYGYIIIHKETGELAPTKSKVFEARNAASVGFYQWTRRLGYYRSPWHHLEDVKFKDQEEFVIKELVISDD